MERSKQSAIITAVLVLGVGIGPVAASQYGGGAGTRLNPYLIRTAEQLWRIGTDPNDWGRHFKLAADLDLKEYDGDFRVIGTPDKPFTGGFNGNRHRILNFRLTIADGNNIGLFGYVDDKQACGGISDLDLVDPIIQAEGSGQVGALVGWLYHATVIGCHVIGGTVTGKSNTGGLVGLTGGHDPQDRPISKASIVGCSSATTVHGETGVGGLLGRHGVGVVLDSWSEGDTSGSDEVGGLIGRNNDSVMGCTCSAHTAGDTCVGGLAGLSTGSVTSCRAQGDIVGSHQYAGGLVGSNEGGTITDSSCFARVQGFLEVGGLVGYHDGTIARCWTSNQVKGDSQVGGLVGSHNAGTITACCTTGMVTGRIIVGGLAGCNWRTIEQCYSTAQVTGDTTTGGLVGCNWRVIQDCYATGRVTGVTTAGGLTGQNGGTIIRCYAAGPVDANEQAGGLVGLADERGRVESCFWDTQASGQSAIAAGIGKTTAQMKEASTFITWGPSTVWRIDEGKDYPRLAWQTTAGEFIESPAYGGGNGSETSPFLIRTAQHLVTLSMSQKQWNKHFKLCGSIDLTAWSQAMEPIGDDVTHFSGSFDGDGGSIIGYSCTSTKERYVGLFGYVEGGVKISRLHLIAPCIDAAKAYNVGALVGFLASGAQILDCHCTDVNLSGDTNVGGLVGENMGTITGCSTAGIIRGRQTIGGLVGHNQGQIAQCFSRADMIAPDDRATTAGGLVGSQTGMLRDSYAAGTVTGAWQVGGLAGVNADGAITNCYCTGLVTGSHDVGGLVGRRIRGDVYASFWDTQTSGCQVSAGGIGKTTAQLQSMDAFVGWVEAGIWTLARGADYPRLTWENAAGEPLLGPRALASMAGEGTAEDPYLIGTAEELNQVGSSPSEWDKHFKLTTDLDLGTFGDTGVSLIGNTMMPFSGTFDGDGHTISDFKYIEQETYFLGLFVVIDGQSACIENLTLVRPSVEGLACVGALVGHLRHGRIVNCRADNVTIFARHGAGGLVAENGGEIHQCCASGSVATEIEDAGGLVGRNEGTIAQSFAAAKCQGLGYTKGAKHIESSGVGGLVGTNQGTITDSYATGTASAEVCAGGLAGYNNTTGTITNCYSTGAVSGTSRAGGLVGASVGTTKNCFWNTQTSYRTTSASGTGQTTGAMKQRSLYTTAGWDFDGETINGTEDIWTITEGQDYPRLTWESAPATEEDR